MENVIAKMNEVTQGRKEFELSFQEYNKLSVEVQKELDRNYWRFPMMSKYLFEEMDIEAKTHFAGEEMVIRHSIFEVC